MNDSAIRFEILLHEIEALKATDRAHQLEAEARITELQDIGSRLVTSRQRMRENIAKHLAQRGRADLATEVRALKFEDPPEDFGILLPGWACICGVFNGEAKKLSEWCRSCGRPKI